MQEGLFRARLNGWGYDESTIRTRVSNCRRVEELEGNLDEHYDRDRCETLLARLTYTRGSCKTFFEGRVEHVDHVDLDAGMFQMAHGVA